VATRQPNELPEPAVQSVRASDTAGSPGRGAPAHTAASCWLLPRPAAIARRHGDRSVDVRGIKGRARSKYDPCMVDRAYLQLALPVLFFKD
jgi:hypothetical protein